MNSKTILTVLVSLLIVFGGAAIYLGIQLNQTPTSLPQTGEDPNVICDTSLQNNGFLFVCDAQGDGQLFSCQDRQYHGAKFAHACAPIINPGSSCNTLENLGVGPWEEDPAKTNFVGCYFSIDAPQNCFCSDYPNGTVQCYTDTYMSGTTYDSCGSRYLPLVISTTPSLSPSPSEEVIITLTPSVTETPSPSPSPSITNSPSEPPVSTVIPKTALVSDEVDRMLLGTVLFLVGITLLFSGKYIGLGLSINNILNGNVLLAFTKKKQLQERKNFEEKFD